MDEGEKILKVKDRIVTMAEAFVKFVKRNTELHEERSKLVEKLVRKEEEKKAAQVRADISNEHFK